MKLERTPVSATVTRYRVEAHLGPDSRLLLIRPDDGLVVTGWRSWGTAVRVRGEWISPHGDLVALVDGSELDRHTTAGIEVGDTPDGASGTGPSVRSDEALGR